MFEALSLRGGTTWQSRRHRHFLELTAPRHTPCDTTRSLGGLREIESLATPILSRAKSSEPRNLVRGRARTLTGTTVASSKPNTTTPTRATALEYSPASPAQTSDYPSTHHGYHPTPHTHHHEATIHRHHPSDPDSKHAAHPPNPHSRKVRHFAKQPPRQATQQFVSKSNDLPNEDPQAEPLRTASAHAYENRLGT